MLRVKMIKSACSVRAKNVGTIFVYHGVRLIMNDKTSEKGVKYSLQHTTDLCVFSQTCVRMLKITIAFWYLFLNIIIENKYF